MSVHLQKSGFLSFGNPDFFARWGDPQSPGININDELRIQGMLIITAGSIHPHKREGGQKSAFSKLVHDFADIR